MTQHFTVDRPRRKQLGLNFENAKRPPAQAVPEHRILEAEVQRSVLALLKKHPRVAFAYRINTRVLDVVDKHSKTGFRPLRTAPKGHPDIAGMLKNGRAIYVECKSSSGSLRPEQAEFLSAVNKHRGIGIVARSIDDVLAQLPLVGAIP